MKKFARHDLNGANLRYRENFSVAIANACPAPMRKAPRTRKTPQRTFPEQSGFGMSTAAGGWLDDQVRQTALVFQSLESRAEFRVDSGSLQRRPMG